MQVNDMVRVGNNYGVIISISNNFAHVEYKTVEGYIVGKFEINELIKIGNAVGNKPWSVGKI